MPTENIKKYFKECIEFINKAVRRKENILIHCRAGMSRSASIVISYLMIVHYMKYEEALKYV
jgi:protein-tyrosine phosphatase